MSAVISLGKFERVLLRNAWPTEDGNFTPWLAEPTNIALLGEALDMGLEVEAIEERVGSFRADILARAVDETEQHRVIIENQFAKTDHGHLGQLLTYLAGIEGVKTVVWIAERIQDDHRAAIDWLNTNTTEEFSFFAIEIELWRIGDSLPAPRFNVIASPNDWTRRAKTAIQQVGERNVIRSHQVRTAYWNSFAEFLKEKGASFRIKRSTTNPTFSFPIGRSGFVVRASIGTEKQRIGVELHIYNDADKSAFATLHVQKEEIERELGEALEWREQVGTKATRIVLYKYGVDPADEKQYPELHAWMLAKMERFRSVFVARVKALPPRSAFIETGEDDESSEE